MGTIKSTAGVALISFALLLTFQLAHAEIYKWVDEKGTVHFTEDPATIPERHKEKVESRATEEDSMTMEEKIRARRQYERELNDRKRTEKNEAELRRLGEQPKRIQKRKEEAKETSDTPSAPSPGYIPFEKFKYITKGMAEAEVLGRLGPPTREEEGEAKSRGTVSGGTVSGFVSPGGSVSGTVSGGSYSGETIVVKRFYYIGDRSKGEQTRIITFERGKVVSYSSITP